MRSQWIGLNIREVQVESNQYARFRAAAVQKCGVRSSAQGLLRNRSGSEACLYQNLSKFCREVLVNLEFQALISSGRSTVPSRANSAA